MPPRQRPSPQPDSSPETSPTPGKGRPTPKRREAEAARKRPLVTNRKEAIRAQRAKDKAIRDREYQAMLTGDERYLPARDKGPVRRWARDYVDARRNPGEYFLPVAIVVMLATFLTQQNPAAAFAIIITLYLVVIVTIIDAILLGRRVRKRVTAKFGAEKVPRGIAMYAILRAFQMRRMRLPKPRAERGAYPR